MGGSSLGPEVIRRSFAASLPDGLRLQVLDSTHPDEIAVGSGVGRLEKTLFIVSSKSGGTIETLSHYRHFAALAKPSQFVVVTDPGQPAGAAGAPTTACAGLPEPAGHRRALQRALAVSGWSRRR